ncbi:YdeI family protein [Paenibacillus sp. NPDC058071]|uniref:YdeI/OmpD-associated family protein n=1 Tax=Paenibacillus sp. NPDC058071 TaxID=3346326 RepID=UPI0036DF6763
MENSISDSIEYIDFDGTADWEAWLAAHHDSRKEAWLRIAKKNSGASSIAIPEALDVALCYGWIDSHRKSLDERCYLQRYSPRRPKSPWSMINVNKAKALIESGRMKPSGYAEIEAAQADGRWDGAYESQKSAAIPPDLLSALEQREQAKRTFEQLDKTAQYAVCLPLLKAATPKNRAAQLLKAIAKLES